MFFVRYAYVRLRNSRVRTFLRAAHQAAVIQRQVLRTKVQRHAETDFGRRHGFASIRNLTDFRNQVPITTYDYYVEYIERVKRGDLQAMFANGTELIMFAMTAGTTARSKYIPITREFFDEYRRGWNLWGVRTYADHIDLVTKKTLKLGSSWRRGVTEGGTPWGNISGLVAETAPPVARSRFVLPSAVTRIEDAAVKQYVALRLALVCRCVGMIGTANPSTLLELARMANDRCESLIRDIHDGRLAPEVVLEADVRSQLERHLARRAPARARELERHVSRSGALLPRDAWPHLSVLAVWTAGSVGVYLPLLKPLYGEPALRDHGLSASEGRMTIPLADGTSAGILEFPHQFFEFIPVDEHESTNPTVLEGHELEDGRDYYILLTTSGGLYRYDIRDVVRCVGYEGQAPLLTFLNKGAHVSSFTGEKLSEHHVVTAVQRSFDELELTIARFTLAPVMDQHIRYVLLLEDGPQAALDGMLAKCVDDHLQRVNWEYAEKRQSGRLLPIRVQRVPAGTWAERRKKKTEELGNFEHYKHPCLVNDLQFMNELAELMVVRNQPGASANATRA
jgi:hypothetical protein